MGIPVLILGESGSGKTYSIRNFEPNEVGVFSVEKGRLPFAKKLPVIRKATYGAIVQNLKAPQMKSYVIDDSQYLMVNEYFDRAKDNTFQKFVDIGLNFRNLLHFINHNVPDDVIVYFLHHTEIDSNTGRIKAKTVGKMLDSYLTVEGCFDIVLLCETNGKEHYFVTQSDGYTTAKSPEGMFADMRIPNDLKAVDVAIRDYWDLNNTKGEK